MPSAGGRTTPANPPLMLFIPVRQRNGLVLPSRQLRPQGVRVLAWREDLTLGRQGIPVAEGGAGPALALSGCEVHLPVPQWCGRGAVDVQVRQFRQARL